MLLNLYSRSLLVVIMTNIWESLIVCVFVCLCFPAYTVNVFMTKTLILTFLSLVIPDDNKREFQYIYDVIQFITFTSYYVVFRLV